VSAPSSAVTARELRQDDDELEDPADVGRQLRVHVARVHRIGRHAPIAEAARKPPAEHAARLFRRTVGSGSGEAAPFVLRVGQIETAGGPRRDRHDPPVATRLQSRSEERIQEMRTEHVGSPVAFEAVWCDLPCSQRGCRIVDKHIELRKTIAEGAGETAHRGQRRKVDRDDRDRSDPVDSMISLREASPRSRLRQPRTTCAPIRASSRAVSLPIPLFAPVTTATRSARSASNGW
jgi:hypothetical protein